MNYLQKGKLRKKGSFKEKIVVQSLFFKQKVDKKNMLARIFLF